MLLIIIESIIRYDKLINNFFVDFVNTPINIGTHYDEIATKHKRADLIIVFFMFSFFFFLRFVRIFSFFLQ